jgi:divalent metal cation (Fe/Co/Zn/Cd) transporter
MNATTIAAVVRHLLGIAGGWLLAKGVSLDAGTIETISGAVGSLIAVGWSLYSKQKPKDAA